ncbi:hypothetical protein HDU81_004244 [Chytriomyces hyalinus]|nr:hypothetical protein HDU81_004244 [Chytriomyces hyalinus]
MTHVSKVALVATLSRAVVATLWMLIAALSNMAKWAPALPYVQSIQLLPYDSSSSLLATTPLSLVLSWDAVYFLRIAETGYPYEQFNAFFPLYPFLARQLSGAITAIVPSISNSAAIVCAALLLSNIAFVLAACMLFKLTQAVLKNDNLAFISAVLFCCSPSAIFMSSLYTESSFALLAFTGMYLHGIKSDWLASLVWMAGTTVRSNGIAFVGFFCYSLLKTCMHAKSFRVIGRKAVATFIQTLVVLSGFAAFQFYGYLLYCKSEDSLKRPWCDANLPLLYSFVQKEYW